MMELETVVVEAVAVKLTTAARMLDVGPTKIHELIKAGKLEVTAELGDRRVIVASIKRLVAPKADA